MVSSKLIPDERPPNVSYDEEAEENFSVDIKSNVNVPIVHTHVPHSVYPHWYEKAAEFLCTASVEANESLCQMGWNFNLVAGCLSKSCVSLNGWTSGSLENGVVFRPAKRAIKSFIGAQKRFNKLHRKCPALEWGLGLNGKLNKLRARRKICKEACKVSIKYKTFRKGS